MAEIKAREMKFQVELRSEKLIKPCTPTPWHLRRYKISAIDELNPSMHVIRILYYNPPAAANHDEIEGAKVLIKLEESLSQILPLFYPLAGRYVKEKHLVVCNDEGAHYSRAQVLGCDLLTLIGSDDVQPDQLNDLLPLEVGAADEPTDPMLAVRVTTFRCGGLAIGICAAHRIFDAASLSIFLTAWADAAAGRRATVIRPDFDSPSLFPAENLAPLDLGVSRTRDGSIVCRRFVFDKNAISKLRDRASDWGGASRPPSRVVVVSAVLTQALARSKPSKSSSSIMIAQAINVRERSVPPVAKHACGSWALNSFVECASDDDFQGLILKMREANVQGVKDCAGILSDREFGRRVLVGRYFDAIDKESTLGFRIVWATDWCKFGDYQLDFGFGTPVWVSLAAIPLKDIFILMNTKENDGIEAWVYLHESQMPSFEQDQDIRMLTATNTAAAPPPPAAGN